MPFVKGQSGNPAGRKPDAEIVEVRDLARQYTIEAIDKLVHWMRTADARTSSAAAEYLIDRGWGKAPLVVEGNIVHKFVAELPAVASNADQWQAQHQQGQPKQLQ